MIYDYRSEKVVQDVIVECLYHIVDDIIDEYTTLHRDEDIAIYAPAYIVKDIVLSIIDIVDDVWIHEDSELKLFHKDSNEVILSLAYDGCIFIEEARGCSKLKSSDAVLSYVYDSFNKKDIDELACYNNSILIFGLKEDDYCIDDNKCGLDKCGCCNDLNMAKNHLQYCKDDNGDTRGFTVSKSDGNTCITYSLYTTEKLDNEFLQHLIESIKL